MKRLISAAALSVALTAAAQMECLNVHCGSVTYNFSSEVTGEMPFSGGATLTVHGRTFQLSDVTSMTVNSERVADNLVLIDYTGESAHVTVAGNLASYLNVAVAGAYVTITQSDEVGDDTCGEITYRLAGVSDDGGFLLNGSYKASLELNGVTLTSTKGAPLDIQNGKRIAMRVTEGTVNTLTDAPDGSQKGCIVCKGHLEFKQKGELNVTGRASHAIYAKEYIELKNSKINVLGAVKDGLNCNQYFLMESGTLTISGVGDDGIQVAFKDDTDREAEDTGSITIKGGTLTVSASAAAAKAIKCDGDFLQTGGGIVASTSGHGKWSASDAKTKAAACISADGTFTIEAGTQQLTSTGSGGKGISCDGKVTISGGEITILTSGGLYAYVNGTEYIDYTGNADRLDSDAKSSPKGIKSDAEIVINGGTINIKTTGTNGEGIESKSTLTVNDGNIKVRAKDDAINSSGSMYINGGVIDVIATSNDGLDSNGNMYITGGIVMAFGASGAECGIDVNDEYGYKLYITGGCVLGVGGRNSTPASSTTGQAYILPGVSVTKGNVLTVKSGTDTLYSFEIPEDYNGSTSGGWRPAPGGPGGMGGSGGVLISLPELTSGASYTVTSGTSTATATACK